ncbi:MAG TPA: hypothetical protein PL110_03300 [Candidatus Eremiobacteraeota bacterium]|nr:hypothetical protein [Candidatus Eremiobacteraeota bacterium]
MFGENLDIIALAEKEIKENENFLNSIKDTDLRKSIAGKLADERLEMAGKSLSENWKKLFRTILIKVIEFILYSYLEQGQKISLAEGFLLFHKSPVWMEKARNFLYQSELLNSRAPVIAEALYAHELGKYNLSVPVLSIQLWGIMKEVFSKPKVMKMESNLFPDRGTHMKITGLCINIPIKSKIKYIDDTFSEILKSIEEFNCKKRAGILSGEDTKYGTLENSSELVMFLHVVLLGLGME